MLWFKGWLETRFKLCLAFAILIALLLLLASASGPPASTGGKTAVFGVISFSNPTLVLMICTLLAGAGIATQPSLQATKGLHGSTLFTLSLPVTRLRLLTVRALIGWLEITVTIATLCCAMLLVSPPLRAVVTGFEMFQYGITLTACASSFYFLSVLLATFLDDQWRVWCTMLAFVAFWWLSSHAPVPRSADIFRAIEDGSPLLAHAMPWTAIAFSLTLAALLFLAALKVAQSREY